jgi:hypothetical protein
VTLFLAMPFRLAMRQTRFLAGWMGITSTVDRQAGQSLLKFPHSSVGDLRVANVEDNEVDELLQMRQPSVCDLGVAEVEVRQSLQLLQMRQTSVGERKGHALRGRPWPAEASLSCLNGVIKEKPTVGS